MLIYTSSAYRPTREMRHGLDDRQALLTEPGRAIVAEMIDYFLSLQTGVLITDSYGCCRRHLGADSDKGTVQSVRIAREGIRRSGRDDVVLWGTTGGAKDAAIKGTWIVTPEQAKIYHRSKVKAFHDEGVDALLAETIENVPEAVGLVQLAAEYRMPIYLSAKLERNGMLYDRDEPIEKLVEEIYSVPGHTLQGWGTNCSTNDSVGIMLDRAAERGLLTNFRILYNNASDEDYAVLDQATEVIKNGGVDAYVTWLIALFERHPELLERDLFVSGCCGYEPPDLKSLISAVEERIVTPHE
ncbi:hypothetical protein GOV09_02960 [Candidatus Woesearchaeota archaeon]|nr:hypothetical protein [Candidatus Woesearchaeota archaeon]